MLSRLKTNFKCTDKLCNEPPFKDSQKLEQHMGAVHCDPNFLFPCPVGGCKFRETAFKSAVRSHLKTIHKLPAAEVNSTKIRTVSDVETEKNKIEAAERNAITEDADKNNNVIISPENSSSSARLSLDSVDEIHEGEIFAAFPRYYEIATYSKADPISKSIDRPAENKRSMNRWRYNERQLFLGRRLDLFNGIRSNQIVYNEYIDKIVTEPEFFATIEPTLLENAARFECDDEECEEKIYVILSAKYIENFRKMTPHQRHRAVIRALLYAGVTKRPTKRPGEHFKDSINFLLFETSDSNARKIEALAQQETVCVMLKRGSRTRKENLAREACLILAFGKGHNQLLNATDPQPGLLMTDEESLLYGIKMLLVDVEKELLKPQKVFSMKVRELK